MRKAVAANRSAFSGNKKKAGGAQNNFSATRRPVLLA